MKNEILHGLHYREGMTPLCKLGIILLLMCCIDIAIEHITGQVPIYFDRGQDIYFTGEGR